MSLLGPRHLRACPMFFTLIAKSKAEEFVTGQAEQAVQVLKSECLFLLPKGIGRKL